MAVVRDKRVQKSRRQMRIRRKIFGTAERPRLSVYRSNIHIYAQLVDDLEGHTLSSADSREVTGARNKTDAARKVGEAIAEKAREAGIETVVFDRGGNMYHGRVRALAEGARDGGLRF
jgi:large subunit ribosomal protein L18